MPFKIQNSKFGINSNAEISPKQTQHDEIVIIT